MIVSDIEFVNGRYEIRVSSDNLNNLKMIKKYLEH
jgi:hypothetical protein